MKETNDYKYIVLEINAQKYNVSLRLSLNDANFIIKHENECSNNYNNLVAKLIINHIIDQEFVPSIEIVASDSKVLTEYINNIVNENMHLSESYKKMSEYQDICQRFVMSIKYMFINAVHPIVDTISQIDFSLMQNIGKTTFSISNQADSTLSDITSAVKESFSKIQEIASIALETIEPIKQISKIASETLSGFSSQLSSLFEKIKIPTISEEEKEELQTNFEMWGKCG